MIISTRGRYAMRMMIDLAEHQGEGYVSLTEIAQRQEISKKYLEQIIPSLNQAGLLQTMRGHQGGYCLTRKPEETTIGAILRATEGAMAPVACLETQENVCLRRTACRSLPVWEGLERVVNEYLEGITLQDVVQQETYSAHE